MENFSTIALEKELTGMLSSTNNAERRLQEAMRHCDDAGMNGHTPVAPFLHFSRRCLEDGEFSAAIRAYGFAMQEALPTDALEKAIGDWALKLKTVLMMDPVLVEVAVRRKREQLQRSFLAPLA